MDVRPLITILNSFGSVHPWDRGDAALAAHKFLIRNGVTWCELLSAYQKRSKLALTQATLKSLLSYDPETGVFHWLPRGRAQWDARYAGKKAGSINQGGYPKIKMFGAAYLAHHLAVLYMTGMWPERLVDHKNGDRLNLRYENLRPAAHHQNAVNRRLGKYNKHGCAGLSLQKNFWRVVIEVRGHRINLGRFVTKEAAIEARKAAEVKYFGEFRHGGSSLPVD